MSRYASLQDLQDVAKAYCKKMGYKFIFANEYKFGFETNDEQLWTLSYFEMGEKLKEMKKEKK